MLLLFVGIMQFLWQADEALGQLVASSNMAKAFHIEHETAIRNLKAAPCNQVPANGLVQRKPHSGNAFDSTSSDASRPSRPA
jgi:hypothetical protein